MLPRGCMRFFSSSLLFFFCLCLFVFWFIPDSVAQTQRRGQNPTPPLQQIAPNFSSYVEAALFDRVHEFIFEHGYEGFPVEIAQVDLNGDSFPELIVCQTPLDGRCPPEGGCVCWVLRDSVDELTPLLRFYAFRVMIQPMRHTKHREIHAYDNFLDHFSYTRYIWSENEEKYVPYRLKTRLKP